MFGNGGHARVVLDICRAVGREVHGILDRNAGRPEGVPPPQILGGDGMLEDAAFATSYEFVIAIAHQRIRRRLGDLVRSKGGVLATVVHPSAVVAPDVTIGRGVVVVAGSVINPGAVLGDLVIVN